MTQITLKGNPIETIGKLPETSSVAPSFKLTRTDMSDVTPEDFTGKNIVMNIFVSLDTSVCAASVRYFNQEVNRLDDTVVLCISADLPFAHKRFCEAEGLEDVIPLSVFRSPSFGEDYGVTITTGPLKGLLSRAIVIVDKSGTVTYSEQVPEIGQEPDYRAVLQSISG